MRRCMSDYYWHLYFYLITLACLSFVDAGNSELPPRLIANHRP